MPTELIDPSAADRTSTLTATVGGTGFPGASRTRALTIVFWLVGLWLSTPIWMSRHFPAEDAPAHLYWTAVYRDLGSPGNPWVGVYERSVRWNTPNLAYFAIQNSLSGWLDPHTAQRVFLLLLLVCWVASIQRLALAAHGRLTVGAFAALLLFHNWTLYMGFFSYLFGIPALVAGVALLATQRSQASAGANRRLVALAGLAVVAYFAHLVTGVLLVLAILLAAALEWRRSRPAALRLLLTVVAPGILGFSYMLSQPFGQGGPTWVLSSAVKRFVGFAFWRGFAAPGFAFWLTLAAFAAVSTFLLARAIPTWRRGELGPGARFVLLFGAGLIVVYFLAPLRVGQGGFLNDRIHLALWAVLLPVLGTDLGRRGRVAVLGLVAILLGWQTISYSLRARRFGEQYESLVREAEAIPTGSVIRYVQPYDASHFEGSFVGPFMDGGEFAFHCRCVLVEDSWQGGPFYWVAILEPNTDRVDYDVWLSAEESAPRGLEPAQASGAGLKLRVAPPQATPHTREPSTP